MPLKSARYVGCLVKDHLYDSASGVRRICDPVWSLFKPKPFWARVAIGERFELVLQHVGHGQHDRLRGCDQPTHLVHHLRMRLASATRTRMRDHGRADDSAGALP